VSVNAELIARIRKILAKTEEAGCTTAEAEAAYGLASSLMAKHNLDMTQVEQAAGLDGEGWTEVMVHESGRASSVFDMVSGVCAQYFFVRPYRSSKVGPDGKRRVVQMFFGSPTNVETARFIFSSLLSAIERLWREEFQRGLYERTDRMVFAVGVINGYSEKLEAERASMIQERDRVTGDVGTALALQTIHDKTLASYRTAHPNHEIIGGRRSFYGSEESHAAGYQAGQRLNLSRPLASSGGPLGLPKK